MQVKDIREKYLKFFEARGHKRIEPAPIIPVDDPTTLFTSSGMQQLVPYLKGEEHPQGKRLVDSQPCFRAEDIEEVGDNRHTTFFEMLGNWSLGDYFKEDQLKWFWEFITEELGLEKDRIHVTLFEGSGKVPKDEESYQIWRGLGISDDHIHWYEASKNWWSRAGEPDNMPIGEIGGPTCEVFYEFEDVAHDSKYGDKCHVNCDCGKYIEIGNSVFMEYEKTESGLKKLPARNVDFGGGLERIAQATQNKHDMFEIDIFQPIIAEIEKTADKKYEGKNKKPMRIIADHLRAAIFMIAEGLESSNKEQGYILRRLLRRAAVKMYQLKGGLTPIPGFQGVCEEVLRIYDGDYFDRRLVRDKKDKIIDQEMSALSKSLDKGLREYEKAKSKIANIPTSIETSLRSLKELNNATKFIKSNLFIKNIKLLITKQGVIGAYLAPEQQELFQELIKIGKKLGITESFNLKNQDLIGTPTETEYNRIRRILEMLAGNIKLSGKWAFRYESTYGIPIEILEEIADSHGILIDRKEYKIKRNEHKQLSRTASAGMFKGGLADNSEEVTKLHTATHLLHQSLRTVLGDEVTQSGSNITGERLRFDYTFSRKPTEDELRKIEDLINKQIAKDLPVHKTIESKEKALASGALAFFREKYDDKVSVYTIGKDPEKDWFSKELCGGPHINSTREIGNVKIKKEENLGAGKRRIYVVSKK